MADCNLFSSSTKRPNKSCSERLEVYKTNNMTAKFGKLKKAVLLLMVVTLLVTIKLFNSMLVKEEKYKRPSRSFEIKQTQPPPREFLKIFHLDLKGGAPKLQFLLKVLPIIRQSGANAILIEYEDMFPFTGILKNISAGNAYSLNEVEKLVEFAVSLNMEVIPLVQTFGHLEYMLKLEEFREFRELESFPQEICPLNKKAVDLVKEMIKQCMAVHPNSRYFHIGCDEVRHVGLCSRCSKFNHKRLFANHVITIAEFIKSEYPGVTSLIWDDMLRRWTFKDMSKSGLSSYVEPVIWVYGDNIFNVVPPYTWNIYQRTFPRLWVASSFKGAFGEREIVPDLTRHLENHLMWMSFLSGEREVILKAEISGVFLTGWSRYDHFAVLCELLPVGIPSLILDLISLDHNFYGKQPEAFSKWLQILQCPPNLLASEAQQEYLFQYKLGNCSFPGSNLYSAMIQFQKLRKRVRRVMKTVELSWWTSRYNLDKNFTSPWRLLEMFPEEGFAGALLKAEISKWKSAFIPLMMQYFDRYTTAEWEEQNIKPLEEKLQEININFHNLIRRKSWLRRPFR